MKKKTAILGLCLAAVLSLSLVSCGVTPPESTGGSSGAEHNYADVIVFMGQSNMGGRGSAEEAVRVGAGHGFEFRAVTDPTTLHPTAEPFGENENNDGISDITGTRNKKTGGLVSAFTEAYYKKTGVPVIGVSASQGGTNSGEWQPGNGLVEEAKSRLELCVNYMYSQDEYELRHIFMVWLQGESDAGNGVQYDEYDRNMRNIVNVMKSGGVEHCYVIAIGTYMESIDNVKYKQYIRFGETQAQMCENNDDMTLVSKKLAGMPESMMHLNNHYRQPAYNIVGNDAGLNTAEHVLTGKAPECRAYVDGETVGD